MPGGIVFSVSAVQLGDGQGGYVACPECGGHWFDLQLRGTGGDRAECSNPDCGHPLFDTTPETPAAAGD